jgi:hypothetical protein
MTGIIKAAGAAEALQKRFPVCKQKSHLQLLIRYYILIRSFISFQSRFRN